METTILVIGAGGALGHHLVTHLSRNHRVLATDTAEGKLKDLQASFFFFPLDVEKDTELLNDLIEDSSIVINLTDSLHVVESCSRQLRGLVQLRGCNTLVKQAVKVHADEARSWRYAFARPTALLNPCLDLRDLFTRNYCA